MQVRFWGEVAASEEDFSFSPSLAALGLVALRNADGRFPRVVGVGAQSGLGLCGSQRPPEDAEVSFRR